MYHHNAGFAADACDRRNIADEIEGQLLVERCVDPIRRTNHEKRIAVCGRMDGGLCGDIAGCARSVLDDERLVEPLRQPLTHEARGAVESATGWKADDQAHRPRRVGLRPCDARDGRERDSSCCQMQELAAWNFHGVSSLSECRWHLQKDVG